jgi:hypothetical protein
MKKVSTSKNPLMINPPRIHLISEIPEPAAYGANALTKKAAENENIAYMSA